MRKKILVLGVFGLFLLMSFTAVGINITKSVNVDLIKTNKSIFFDDGDQMDQKNIRSDGFSWGCPSGQLLAQSFKPTLEILTRVEVRLRVQGSPGGLEISIRESLDGDDLTSLYIPTEEMIIINYWAEFDFTNIVVTPEKTYYIVWNPIDVPNPANAFFWDIKVKNYYERGSAWQYDGEEWEKLEIDDLPYGDPDFCFITYGFSNQPPNKPSQPSGPLEGLIGEDLYYEFFFSDPDGDDMSILFDWDDGTTSGWIAKGGNGTFGMSHSWTSNGVYEVKTKAKDSYVDGDWSDPYTIIIGNVAPDIPSRPSGPSSGKIIFKKYTYSTETVDLNGDDVFYLFDWGDGKMSGWLGPYLSGDICSESHTWMEEGSFNIKVKAKDESGEESDWSEPLSVTMPKNNPYINTLIINFFENHPIIYQFIQRFLKL